MHADELLKLAFELKASDVHLTVGRPPVFRVHGKLFAADELGARAVPGVEDLPVLTAGDTEALARQLIPGDRFQQFMQVGESDLSYAIPGVGRFRVNAFKQRGTVALAIRLIPERIPTFDELGLPEVVAHLARRPRGLVLVTGPTGSGKSTTLAAMIDLINSESRLHIITLEDPIEYVHRHKKSLVNQREIGRDSLSFAAALRAALREDPDVILVGEMRDLETIATAITAAETGHLVLATLHTTSAAQTIDRIIDVFPPHQQQQVRLQLAGALEGVIAQQLLPRRDRPGRVAALEILVATPAIRNLIREGKTHQIVSQLQTGARYGMQTLDMALRNLVRAGVIGREEALGRAADAENLLKMI
ncbi:type IV pilus twitching motility protein PilT [Desulfofundulus thermosubterraneus]|uniref:Twitching motility protein PilT n=1 Tax=Desulfofundulus thermosubterraneus DSM 16057 TaxID=1121432 RepID=A0A1M6GFU5_9FIRM|nr:type IV pilus twitching motility protein PilT [Desulfofundulus thermosubterraneus]SHJ08751.1 twitching motility protein PilT [Desulfofundulus thermosubterraneus DSM 16057]